MAWDRKKRGAKGGYFYLSVRSPEGVKKLYFGRRTAGHAAAAAVDQRRQARLAARKLIREERAATAEADHQAAGLFAWAELLSAAWLVLTGHERRRGEWRKRRGKEAEGRNAEAVDRHLPGPRPCDDQDPARPRQPGPPGGGR